MSKDLLTNDNSVIANARFWKAPAPRARSSAALRDDACDNFILCNGHGSAPRPQAAIEGPDSSLDRKRTSDASSSYNISS